MSGLQSVLVEVLRECVDGAKLVEKRHVRACVAAGPANTFSQIVCHFAPAFLLLIGFPATASVHPRGGCGMMGRGVALVLLSVAPLARSQYLKSSKDELVVEKYYEVQQAGTKDLENLLGEHPGCPSALPTYLRTTTASCYPYLNEKYNPQDGVLLQDEFKPFADIDKYRWV